ncbi:MAG: phenylalanine--tRNA ligase subunit beta, partial [Ignavibacteriae bacterium]|nr:phenylalanine--tRNA ligase subunit beta [Ignavibacteriota bacterium]
VMKHPHADKLTVCRVNIGKEILQIVCGAPNVASGQKVPVGLMGAIIPHNQHDPEGKPFTISQIKIRNVDSYGIICSSYELGLGDDKNGIMVLDNQAGLGTPFSTYLGLDDTVFEIGIAPNRPDAMSHIGIAREVGVFLGRKVTLPAINVKESKASIQKFTSIIVKDHTNCPRYTAKVVFNVKIGESPKWMQNILDAVGIRPINNIVDVTNYVLMEIGHPLHAFDYDKLSGKKIIVKRANVGDTFTTLDDKQRILREDTLMICDAERPVAVAGVMGGANTEISATTTNVFLESAYFRPQSIRRTAKYLGLRTEASQRFERGVDSNITRWAVERAAQLMQAFSGGEVLKGAIDVYPRKLTPKKITLRVQKVNEILGTRLQKKTVLSLLCKLEIYPTASSQKKSKDTLTVYVPTFRPDLEREIDLIEEVARLYGYDNIEIKTHSVIRLPERTLKYDLTEALTNWLVESGYREVIANSMQDKMTASLASSNIVEIANPISREMAALRTSLIPGILGIIRHNIFHGSKTLRLFELGKVYFHDATLEKRKTVDGYFEEERLILAYADIVHPPTWDEKPRFIDIFDVKGELQTLFMKFSLDKFKFIPYSNTKALTELGLQVEINGEYAGFLGSIRRELLRQYEIEQDVFVTELVVETITRNIKEGSTFKALPRYPAVRRDVAFVVDEALLVEVIEQEIRSVSGTLLTDLKLFDVYKGDQIGLGKKSCAFSLEFRSDERTLSDDEVNMSIQNIIDRITIKFDATIRQ